MAQVCMDGGIDKFYYMWKALLLMIVVVALISYFWVEEIDYMKENHPDYEGEDWLNWDDNYDSDEEN